MDAIRGDMDWSAMVRQLMGAGVTQTQIAEFCQVKQNTVSDWARARSLMPSWGSGERLIALWRQQCAGGSKRAIPPTKQPESV